MLQNRHLCRCQWTEDCVVRQDAAYGSVSDSETELLQVDSQNWGTLIDLSACCPETRIGAVANTWCVEALACIYTGADAPRLFASAFEIASSGNDA